MLLQSPVMSPPLWVSEKSYYMNISEYPPPSPPPHPPPPNPSTFDLPFFLMKVMLYNISNNNISDIDLIAVLCILSSLLSRICLLLLPAALGWPDSFFQLRMATLANAIPIGRERILLRKSESGPQKRFLPSML